jgi:hypothetical protein
MMPRDIAVCLLLWAGIVLISVGVAAVLSIVLG